MRDDAEGEWVTQGAPLRWLVQDGTTTDSPRLQQVYVCPATGAREWRDVPVVIAGQADNRLPPIPPPTKQP